MNVTLPNGKVIQGVPEGTSKDAIAQKAISAGLATPEDFGIKPAPSVDINSLSEIGMAPELNELSMPAFKTSLGLLTTTDPESLKGIFSSQFGNKATFEDVEDGGVIVNLPSGKYALNKPGLSGQDVASFAFQALGFTPAGAASTIGKAAAGAALTEGAMAATESGLGGKDVDAGRIVEAAALGGAFKGVENAVGAGYRALKGSKQQPELVKQATDSGIPMMTSDVLPPKTFAGKTAQQTAEKIPFAGTGAAREQQQAFREKAVSDVIDKYGEYSYKSIMDSLKSQKDKVKKAAGSVLNETGRKLDDAGELSLENTRAAISKADDELSKSGVIQSGGAIDDLQKLTEALKQPQTFTTLKENRTAFREIVNSTDKADRSQLTSRAKSLLRSVEAGMSKDMDELAKKTLSPQELVKWKKANSVYAEEAKKLTKTKLKNVLDKGDMTPESVQSMLFSQKPSELKSLYDSLTIEGRRNARSAIISKAVDSLSKRQAGITPNSFASELKKYDQQINQFFKGSERKQLQGLRLALEATRRAQDAAITTPTGQQLLGAGTAAAAVTDLGATILAGGTVGGIARLYESAPVRNALLKLASVPKGSTQFEKALLEVQTALSASAQSARDE